jgi:hypothetical protein
LEWLFRNGPLAPRGRLLCLGHAIEALRDALRRRVTVDEIYRFAMSSDPTGARRATVLS